MSEITIKKPTSVAEFNQYILEKCKPTVGFGPEFEKYYLLNQQTLYEGLNESNFWKEFVSSIKEIDAKYSKDHRGYDLILNPENIKITKKKLTKAIEKSYRLSIIVNKSSFESQEYFRSIILPENIFEKMNDIIRAEIIVKYLDGVDVVIDYLYDLSKKYGFDVEVDPKITEEGYFAKHLLLSSRAGISDFQYKLKEIKYTFEIQVRTQLQDTVKAILHKQYEQDRMAHLQKDTQMDWRWQYKEPRFITNYIGHILHFFDGVIVKIKNQKED